MSKSHEVHNVHKLESGYFYQDDDALGEVEHWSGVSGGVKKKVTPKLSSSKQKLPKQFQRELSTHQTCLIVSISRKYFCPPTNVTEMNMDASSIASSSSLFSKPNSNQRKFKKHKHKKLSFHSDQHSSLQTPIYAIPSGTSPALHSGKLVTNDTSEHMSFTFSKSIMDHKEEEEEEEKEPLLHSHISRHVHKDKQSHKHKKNCCHRRKSHTSSWDNKEALTSSSANLAPFVQPAMAEKHRGTSSWLEEDVGGRLSSRKSHYSMSQDSMTMSHESMQGSPGVQHLSQGNWYDLNLENSRDLQLSHVMTKSAHDRLHNGKKSKMMKKKKKKKKKKHNQDIYPVLSLPSNLHPTATPPLSSEDTTMKPLLSSLTTSSTFSLHISIPRKFYKPSHRKYHYLSDDSSHNSLVYKKLHNISQSVECLPSSHLPEQASVTLSGPSAEKLSSTDTSFHTPPRMLSTFKTPTPQIVAIHKKCKKDTTLRVADLRPLKKLTTPIKPKEPSPPSISPPPPVKPSSNALMLFLRNVHHLIQKKDPKGIFVKPVTGETALGYSSVISKPMDLTIMANKVEASVYTSVQDFKDDFILMCNNAMTYNAPGTMLHVTAKRLLYSGLQIITEETSLHMDMLHGFVHTDSIPSVLPPIASHLKFSMPLVHSNISLDYESDFICSIPLKLLQEYHPRNSLKEFKRQGPMPAISKEEHHVSKEAEVNQNSSSSVATATYCEAHSAANQISQSDLGFKTCLFVKYQKKSAVLTKSCIESALRDLTGVQNISVYHTGCQYYGQVDCVSKDHAKAAIRKFPTSVFEVRYWRATDKIGIQVQQPSTQSSEESISVSSQNTSSSANHSLKIHKDDGLSTTEKIRVSSECDNKKFSALHQNPSPTVISKGSSAKTNSSSPQSSTSSAAAGGDCGHQEPWSYSDGTEKSSAREPCTKATGNTHQDSYTVAEQNRKCLPSHSKLFEGTTIEESFPCSKEMMAYLVKRFHEKDFLSLWKSIEPVQVYCKGQELYMQGTDFDIQVAKTKVLEHPLVQGLFFEFIHNLRKETPQNFFYKVISTKFPKTVLLYKVGCDNEHLLYSKSFSELQEAKKFLMNVVPQTRTYNIKDGTQVDTGKLNRIIESMKSKYIDVTICELTIDSPNTVVITSLCEQYVEFGWHQVQQCFQEVTDTVFITNIQLSQFRKDFTDKANSLSCQIAVTKIPDDSIDCASITIKGYTEKDVKETVTYILSKCAMKQRILFKNVSAGHIITSSQFSRWLTYAQNKKIKFSKLQDCCGFLVEGNPKPVKETVKSLLQNYHSILENAACISYGQVILKSFYRPVCTIERVADWKEELKNKFMSYMAFSFVSSDHSSNIHEEVLRVSKDHVVTINIVIGKLSKEETDAIVVPTDSVKNDNIYPIQLSCLQEESFQDGYQRCLHSYQVLRKSGATEILDGGSLPCARILHVICPLASLLSKSQESDFISKSLSFASIKRIGSISFPHVDHQMMPSVINTLISLDSPTIHTVRVVVKSQQIAKLYTDALQKLVSLSPTSPSTCQTDLTTFNKYRWSWKDDNGIFVSYDPVSTRLLNDAYQKDSAGTCDLQISHQYYKIDFQIMKQRNISSLHEREVIKSSPKVKTSQQSVTWKYMDDSGRYSAYLPKDSAQIEAMYQKHDMSQFMMINSRIYSFDFDDMLQINAETEYSRDIKREVTKVGGSILIDSPFQAGFLHENEVIVNFKSPAQHYQNVKTYIQDRMEEQLSCEDINLPLTTLPDHLEAIIKKHSMVSCELTTAGPTQGKRAVLRIKGLEAHVQKAQTELQKAIIDGLSPVVQPSLKKETHYPHTWEPMTEGEQCRLVQLARMSDEYVDVSTKFWETMSGFMVADIQRVQNKWIWERYAMTKRRMSEKNNGRVNELELFHGSRTAPSTSICKSEEGFDMRFSREGLWGQANYFAKNASYSDDYAYYKDQNTVTKEMMLAQVLTGDSYECKPNKSLRMPPEKNNRGSQQDSKLIQRYDSVCGMTNNCKVYMTYCNENAYPAYIITYSMSYSGVTGNYKYSSHIPSKVTGLRQPSTHNIPSRTSTVPSYSNQVPSQQQSSLQVPQQLTQSTHANLATSQQPSSSQVPYQQFSQQYASQTQTTSRVPIQQSPSQYHPSSSQQPPSQQYQTYPTSRIGSTGQKDKATSKEMPQQQSSCVIS